MQLRLQFESKLNSLHSLHRDVKAQHNRAVEEILQLKTAEDENKKQIEKQNEELIALRSEKVEHLSKIAL